MVNSEAGAKINGAGRQSKKQINKEEGGMREQEGDIRDQLRSHAASGRVIRKVRYTEIRKIKAWREKVDGTS